MADDRELWREAAACRGTDPELFFPISSRGQSREQSERAKDFCTRCPVARCCLEFALRTRQMHGVWGGMTEEERTQILVQDQRESFLAAGAGTLTRWAAGNAARWEDVRGTGSDQASISHRISAVAGHSRRRRNTAGG